MLHIFEKRYNFLEVRTKVIGNSDCEQPHANADCFSVLVYKFNVWRVSEQRISDVKYRDDELRRSLEDNKIETEAIVEMRARVDKMIDRLQELLHISQQCLVKRSASTRRIHNA